MTIRYGFGFVGVFCVVSLLLTVGPAVAGGLDLAYVLLHIGDSPALPAVKACLGSRSGVQEDCLSWESQDSDLTGYGMTTRYTLIVTAAPEAVGSLSCGIRYSGNLFVAFDVCTDGVEFPNNDWPASGGGNRITWTTCGATLDPAYADRYAWTGSGLQVVFGSFYVYTYGGNGYFHVIKNPLGPGSDDDELAVSSCTGEVTFLEIWDAGQVGIGDCSGYNICCCKDPGLSPSKSASPGDCYPVPVVPTTWGGLKHRYGEEKEGGNP